MRVRGPLEEGRPRAGSEAPQAVHRGVQEADSRSGGLRQVPCRGDARVRPRQVDARPLDPPRAHVRLHRRVNVNLFLATFANIPMPDAPMAMRHARQRIFTGSGQSPLLLSAGRSLSLYDLPVIFIRVQWWQSLSAIALAATSSPKTLAQPPMPTFVITIVDRCS